MLEGLITLASYGFYSGGIGEMLVRAEELGVFTYLLPFLLIFALVNGILTRVNLFNENKAINAIIALVVGLLALQFGFVSAFFSEIFPRLGIGLVIVLAILIIVGLFVDPENKGIMYALLGVSAVIVAIVLIQSGIASGTTVGYWFEQYWQAIAWVVGIAIVIAIIAGASSSRPRDPYKPIWPFGPPAR